MKLTAVILTHNEQEKIADCIKSLKFCDEVIVVDDNSIDETTSIARKLGTKVYIRKLDSNFAQQRNFGLKMSEGEWILFVDADERVTLSLAKEILRKIKLDQNFSGFFCKRRDFLWGKELKHGEAGNVRLLRLAKKGAGVWRREVHEVWDVKGEVAELDNPLVHYPHQTLSEFIKNINDYTSLHAQANRKEGKTSSVFKIIVWPMGHFVFNFIIRGGFLDGNIGFVFAVLMSFSSFLAWGKLWMLQKGFSKI